MASRKAAAASDTVTFKKSELAAKVKKFLEDHDACEGDWLNKVKVEFLGQKRGTVRIEAKKKVTVDLEMPYEGALPTKDEAAACLQHMMDEGDFCGYDDDGNENEFEVVKVTKL